MATTTLTSTEAVPEAVSGKDEYEFDVFVNYHDSDEQWVYDHLKQRLNQADVRFSDRYDFRVGPPKLQEMARCIKESRWTVLILTRAYLASSWNDCFTTMSQTLGVEQEKWRTIVVRVEEDLQLPPSLEMLCGIDLSRDPHDEMEWDRLIRGVGGTAPERESIAQSPIRRGGVHAVRKGLDALIDLLASPEICEAVSKFQNDFQTCCEQIEILSDYKALHDQLHVLQFQCFTNIAMAAPGFPDGPGCYQMMSDALHQLDRIVSHSRAIADRGKVASQSWIGQLATLQGLLSRVHEEFDPAPLATILPQLGRILQKDPSKINNRLNQTASALRLPHLEMALSKIRGVMDGPTLDPEKVSIFDAGLKALVHLGGELAAAVDEHNRWQELDDELRYIEGELKDESAGYDLASDWSSLVERMGGLYAVPDEWGVKLQADAAALTSALEARNARLIRYKFADFRAKAGIRFYEIDAALLRHCGELRMVTQPLFTLMEFAG